MGGSVARSGSPAAGIAGSAASAFASGVRDGSGAGAAGVSASAVVEVGTAGEGSAAGAGAEAVAVGLDTPGSTVVVWVAAVYVFSQLCTNLWC